MSINLERMSLDDIVDNRTSALAYIEEARGHLEACNAELIRRAAEKHATTLFTDHNEIEISRMEKIQYRIDVLRTLYGKIPNEIFDQAVYLETPAPVWKTNAVKLKSIAKKYGSEIAEIVAKGMPYEQVGTPKIKITPRSVAPAAPVAMAA
jgi:hypothetical protein